MKPISVVSFLTQEATELVNKLTLSKDRMDMHMQNEFYRLMVSALRIRSLKEFQQLFQMVRGF
jgi:hypothetical protein